MKPSPLTRCEWTIVRCLADDCLSVRETSDRLCVIYQCVANHVQTIYDKLGIKRNLQALTKWYFTHGRELAAAILLAIFSTTLFNGQEVIRRMRRRIECEVGLELEEFENE